MSLPPPNCPRAVPLDDGTGWARLNLYAAASGYGAFNTNVTVDMNAALGGLNAFDVWSNDDLRPWRSDLARLRHPDPGRQQQLYRRHRRARRHARGHRHGGRQSWRSGPAPLLLATASSAVRSPCSPAPFTRQGSVPSGASLLQVGGTATLSGGTLAVGSFGDARRWAAPGRSSPRPAAYHGSFGVLTEPSSGLAAGTRFDTLYGSNVVSLAVTPSLYGNLAAAGVPQSSSESGVGTALDAIRPAPGVAMDPAAGGAVRPALYACPPAASPWRLDELAPSIYPDAMITARNSWYLMADAVSGQLASRRGLAADHTATSAPGPDGSTIWVSGLGGYDSIGAGGGSPGFTAGLGRHGGRHRRAGGRHRADWCGGRNGRGADLVAGRRQRHQQHGAVCQLRPMAARHVLRRGATRA